MLIKVVLAIHLLAMIGTFGGLLLMQAGLSPSVRNSDDTARGAARFLSLLIGIGLLAGLAYYFMTDGPHRGPHFNGVIGTKFVILLAVGALLAMSKRPGKGDMFRTLSLVLLVVAALIGVTL